MLANLGLAISAAIVIAVLYYLGELKVFKTYFSKTGNDTVGTFARSNG